MDELEIMKFYSLSESYSKEYIEFLIAIAKKYKKSFAEISTKLPTGELVKKDEYFIGKYPIARVLMGIDDPATYVLTYFHILDKIPEDYPEQPKYYISTSEGYVKAPITKQEFLDSLEEAKIKKIRK